MKEFETVHILLLRINSLKTQRNLDLPENIWRYSPAGSSRRETFPLSGSGLFKTYDEKAQPTSRPCTVPWCKPSLSSSIMWCDLDAMPRAITSLLLAVKSRHKPPSDSVPSPCQEDLEDSDSDGCPSACIGLVLTGPCWQIKNGTLISQNKAYL